MPTAATRTPTPSTRAAHRIRCSPVRPRRWTPTPRLRRPPRPPRVVRRPVAQEQLALARGLAPGTQIKPGAYRAAVSSARDLPAIGGTWKPYGDTPLQGNHTDYDTTNGSTSEGLGGLSGRTTSFARDAPGTPLRRDLQRRHLEVDRQRQLVDVDRRPLPTQVVSGIAWTSAGGGTLVVLTGDNAFGGDTYAGLGVYRTTDRGATWTHATGVPDGVLGFKLAVDPTNAEHGLRGDRRRPVPLDRRRRDVRQREPADGRRAGRNARLHGQAADGQGLLPGQHGHRRRRPGRGERADHRRHAGRRHGRGRLARGHQAERRRRPAVARQRHLRRRTPARPARSRTWTWPRNATPAARPADAGADRPGRARRRRRRRSRTTRSSTRSSRTP